MNVERLVTYQRSCLLALYTRYRVEWDPEELATLSKGCNAEAGGH